MNGQKLIWEKRLNEYVKREAVLTENVKTVYSLKTGIQLLMAGVESDEFGYDAYYGANSFQFVNISSEAMTFHQEEQVFKELDPVEQPINGRHLLQQAPTHERSGD